MDALIGNFQIIAIMMQSVSILIAVILTLMAIVEFKKLGEQRSMMSHQHGAAKPLIMLICAAILFILPNFIGTALLTFFGSATPLPYEGDGGTGMRALIPLVVAFVRLIGVGSFIRGIVMLSKTGGQQSQPGQIGKGLMHIFAGILCINIVGTTDLLKSILGL